MIKLALNSLSTWKKTTPPEGQTRDRLALRQLTFGEQKFVSGDHHYQPFGHGF